MAMWYGMCIEGKIKMKITHVWYCQLGPRSGTGYVLGPRGQPITIFLLNGHSVKLLPKLLSLYL